MHRLPGVGDVISIPAHGDIEWIVCGVDDGAYYLLDEANNKKRITCNEDRKSVPFHDLKTLQFISQIKVTLANKLFTQHFS
jgi:hypothetical protein